MIWIVVGSIPIILCVVAMFLMMAADLGIRHALVAFAVIAAILAIISAAALSIGYGIEQL